MRPATGALLGLVLGLSIVEMARAHSEGLTPYRYVTAPPGVRSEGPPEMGVSTQPIGRAGFAGTTDNQMQLTLSPDVLPPSANESGVRITLGQLDPGDLPALPAGLEPEGNGYTVGMAYASSGKRLARLDEPASLGLTAPAAPTALYELRDGAWKDVRYTAVESDTGFTSVVRLTRPGTFLQAYDPATTPPAAAAAPIDPQAASGSSTTASWAVFGGGAGLLLVAGLAAFRRRCRSLPAGGLDGRTPFF